MSDVVLISAVCQGLYRLSRREMCDHRSEYGVLHMPNNLHVYVEASGQFAIYTEVSEVSKD